MRQNLSIRNAKKKTDANTTENSSEKFRSAICTTIGQRKIMKNLIENLYTGVRQSKIKA